LTKECKQIPAVNTIEMLRVQEGKPESRPRRSKSKASRNQRSSSRKLFQLTMEGKSIEVTDSREMQIPQESKLGSRTRTPNTKEICSSSNSLRKCFQLTMEYKYIEAKTEPVCSPHQNGNSQPLDPGSSMRRRTRRCTQRPAEIPVELTLENTCSVNLGHCGCWVDWAAKGQPPRPFGK
jgi:hypothetical protein